MKNKYNILFATIAPREVEFFVNIAIHLKKNYNLTSCFLSFVEYKDEYIEKKGFKVFKLHKHIKKNGYIKYDIEKLKNLEKKIGLKNIRSLLTHEKLTFNRFDEKKLLRKLLTYNQYFSEIFKNNDITNVVQELGAFVAPLILYYTSRIYEINHVFLEPSFFKDYLFFNKNSLNISLKNENNFNENVINKVKNYINEYNNDKTVVIPLKDTQNFQDAGIKKLISTRYVKRFFQKIYHKYVLKQKEEYDAIFNQTLRFFIMYFRRKFFSFFYDKTNNKDKYFYFPLHVPIDFALTFREPGYINQLALIEKISNFLPLGYKLYIKEHPASIGGYNFFQMREILKNKNVILLHPSLNSYDIIKKSIAVITINSKVGGESLMQGKPIIVLGNTYYKETKNAYFIEKIENIKKTIDLIVNKRETEIDYNLFYKIFSSSEKAELYSNTKENIQIFSDVLYRNIIV